MPKAVRVSLANKCQFLFGAAVILILVAALAVVWGRMNALVREGQQETARKLANAWLDSRIDPSPEQWQAKEDTMHVSVDPGVTIEFIRESEFIAESKDDEFLAGVIYAFQSRDDVMEQYQVTEDVEGQPLYRYARAVRRSDINRIRSMTNFSADLDTASIADPINSLLLVHLRPDITNQQRTEKQFRQNLISIISAGLLAGLLAIGAFWFITTRIILSPVRVLRDTAEKIAEGDINIRSDINTGDEYEQLSDMFNTMLERLRDQQHQLRRTNKSLDLKLGELAETNVALYEADKIKGEFLANVSHELRTPLNSIIGFAEVLAELLPSSSSVNPEQDTPDKTDKFQRYSQNIITSSKLLLNLINDLLDIAKIEAGRLEVNVDPMSVRDTCEGLLTLIQPLAEKSSITLELQCQRNLPAIETDAGKVHQILFNFLSNAVKFTPANGTVTLAASLTDTVVGSLRPGERRIRISVTDSGPGIPFDDQERIFDKFIQLDTSHTRSHGGTGLGLTICRDLTRLLQGEIELESEAGSGATFSILLPVKLAPHVAPLMPDLT